MYAWHTFNRVKGGSQDGKCKKKHDFSIVPTKKWSVGFMILALMMRFDYLTGNTEQNRNKMQMTYHSLHF